MYACVYMYVCVYIYVCVYMCVCVCECVYNPIPVEKDKKEMRMEKPVVFFGR